MNKLKRLWCRFVGHDWQTMDGWLDEGEQVRECSRCGDLG